MQTNTDRTIRSKGLKTANQTIENIAGLSLRVGTRYPVVMIYDPGAIDKKFREALIEFWTLRAAAKEKGKDKTGRGEAVSGQHLDPLIHLLEEVIRDSGLQDAHFYTNRRAGLPGFYRPSKQWDLVVVYKGKLAIIVELKSQVGSYGNNFNNRVEEALGSALDLQSALMEGVLKDFTPGGGYHAPFRGWLMVLAEEEESIRRGVTPNAVFPVDGVFLDSGKLVSYADRYRIFASRLVQSKQYDAAAIVTVKRGTGEHKGYGLDSFWRELAFFSAKLAST